MQEFIRIFLNLGPIAYAVLAINILLLLSAKWILSRICKIDRKHHRYTLWLMLLRSINILTIIAFGYYYWYKPVIEKGPALTILAILTIIYVAYLMIYLGNYFILKNYGTKREVEGKQRLIKTYQTRSLSILSNVLISIVAVISIVRLLGFESLLEAGGVIGFIGVFLALTQSTWAPDIFSGLIILNSDMLEEGDIIELHDGDQIYGKVYKTKLFHTEILNLADNHRIMVRNALLRNFTIHNLSKFASARGLREKLIFKISYETPAEDVHKMFQDAFNKGVNEGLEIEAQHGLEIGIQDTGDHAVEWLVFYYTKNIQTLLRTRQLMLAEFYAMSQHYGISLSTPYTHQIQGQQANREKTAD